MKENNQFVTVAEVAFMHQADFVKTILENHHFEFGVNSEIGKGSEFWFIM